jgi:AcrR family transcriptional regulator
VPTGVALRDVRDQLFDAAERILLRAGAQALTSRAVTTEAGCAKGVLHRHFADFDTFLTELVLDRAARVEARTAALIEAAGTGTVTDNLTEALTALSTSVAARMMSLIIFRDDLRTRLRAIRPPGIPLITESVAMIVGYLRAEQEKGRIAAHADVETLALTLIGSGHLLSAGSDGSASPEAEVHKVVASVLAGA